MKRICVFCGSSRRSLPHYLDAARSVGEELARRGIGLVYGGANVGTMGAVADAVLAGGGQVIGVIPDHFAPDITHQGVRDLRVVTSMHERKATMAKLANAFIALPGAYGTLDEFCEILAWRQLRIHDDPCVLLNLAGYYDGFLEFLDHAVSEQFLRPDHRALFLVESDPERIVERVVTAWDNAEDGTEDGTPDAQSSNMPSKRTVLK